MARGATYTGIAARDECLSALQAAKTLIGPLPVVGDGLHLFGEARNGLRLLRKLGARILSKGILNIELVGGSHERTPFLMRHT